MKNPTVYLSVTAALASVALLSSASVFAGAGDKGEPRTDIKQLQCVSLAKYKDKRGTERTQPAVKLTFVSSGNRGGFRLTAISRGKTVYAGAGPFLRITNDIGGNSDFYSAGYTYDQYGKVIYPGPSFTLNQAAGQAPYASFSSDFWVAAQAGGHPSFKMMETVYVTCKIN